MKILTIGDPHFKVDNVKDTDLMVEAIYKIIEKESPNFVVVLGDILDRHENIHVSPLTRATNFLYKIQTQVKTYVLIGNHDLKNNQQFLSDEHPFVALKSWSNLTVVSDVVSDVIGEHLFTFVPYVPNGRFQEALNLRSDSWISSKIIFAHQEFKGCKMGALLSTTGDDWGLDLPQVISGHIHDYQIPQTNIMYVGTPIQHTYGDHDDKAITLITVDDTIQYRRISLGLPKKKIIHLDYEKIESFVFDSNIEAKIVIHVFSNQAKAAIKHYRVKEWKNLGYKVVIKEELKLETKNTDVEIAKPRISYSFAQIFYETVKQNPVLESIYLETFAS